MDYVLVSDIARYYVVIAALWLIAVLARLSYVRLRDYGLGRQDSPHPLSTMGLAVLMGVAIVRRFDTLGQPGDAYLWWVLLGVSAVLVGVLCNVRFNLRPPWRRG